MRRRATTATPATLAVVDMGSNSFRLEVGRVEGGQIYRLDTVRETLRMGAGLDERDNLTPHAQREAIACLARFGERLRGFDRAAVRAVATNTFRVARNVAKFLPRAEAALGFPIDVIGGHEEARLIYVGVAHELPASDTPRLVVDIGGGSTEFIVGRGMNAERLESLKLGCVTMSRRFFADGSLDEDALEAAETHAQVEVEAIAREFSRRHWRDAFASSGTALALADILELNGFSQGGITPDGLARLRKRMVAARHIKHLKLEGLKAERAPVLAGGFAVMAAAVHELGIARIDPVGGALRLGVLYDLLGRREHRDSREVTVASFVERHHVDRSHAERVAALARRLYAQALSRPDPDVERHVGWAALLHEVGYTVSHLGFHKHGAYILGNADMPGFSRQEQQWLAMLVLACRGGLDKVAPILENPGMRAQVLALRLAVLLHHARQPVAAPRVRIRPGRVPRVEVAAGWLRAHPLTAHLLAKEREEWAKAGWRVR
ncbi:MAG: Ppx/GppA family phosphatase [Burkholderiales bacterium]|jgi:exopolyphosphatase/guanosine-5'-triphosphate,3'-diphosphate pyrophosphatase|nr:Ppx/GppA family phosphatase [Burkholderiales bacterium]